MNYPVEFVGLSGKKYTYYNIINPTPDGIKPLAGNYAVVSQQVV